MTVHKPKRSTARAKHRNRVIVRAAIHPAIGIARVGDSIKGFFYGPEVTHPPAKKSYRDADGALKRQAARFRIYGYNAAGKVVRELTARNADITWTVHLANKKAAWYRFRCAFDVPEMVAMSVLRRNPEVVPGDRQSLIIDAGPRSIHGKSVHGPRYVFEGGRFKDQPVTLGELRTNRHGHLVVLGGHGASGSPTDAPIYDSTNEDAFGNADGWFDDTSDGPVTAVVRVAGQPIPVDKAWVVVAPVNYAPGIVGWRTLYDRLMEVYLAAGWIPMPETVSFTEHILPVLQRLSNLQWVNAGFAALFGKGRPMDFDDPKLIAKLAQPPRKHGTHNDDPYRELRQLIVRSFRPAAATVRERQSWPWFYGDTIQLPPNNSPNDFLAWTPVREELMNRWANGDFVNTGPIRKRPPQKINEVPLSDQPAILDRAALDFCLADAFHPGSEVPWLVRNISIYEKPFRIRHRPASQPEPDYGPGLNQQIALAPGGPAYAQGPGDLTRWMAVPWQADLPYCRSGYSPKYDAYLPAFWPARVPNQVLTQEDYRKVMNRSLPRDERIAAFNRRDSWFRDFGFDFDNPIQAMGLMVKIFGAMGVVEARRGPKNDPDISDVIFVESRFGKNIRKMGLKAAAAAKRRKSKTPNRIQQAGWESEEQVERARAVRFRHS